VIEKDAISVVYFYQTSVRLHNKENLIILFFKKVKKKSVGIIFWGWLRRMSVIPTTDGKCVGKSFRKKRHQTTDS
jgi:hypothetical protein